MKIEWYNGYMEVNLNRFFPCTKVRFNKLLKIIYLDADHRDELKQNVREYLEDLIQNFPEKMDAFDKEAKALRAANDFDRAWFIENQMRALPKFKTKAEEYVKQLRE